MNLKSIVLISILIIGCVEVFGQEMTNQFSSETDTLLIRTTRMKGSGVFDFGGGFLEFQDTTNLFDYPLKLPQSLSDVLGTRVDVDLNSELDYIDMIKGQLPSEEVVVIVDQNNNQSFLDDSLFSLQPIEWYSSKNAIPITFLVSDGAKTAQHQSLIRIGNWDDDIIYGKDEYLSASITIDDKNFEVGITDSENGAFTYSSTSKMALLSSALGKKDSIQIRDLIKVDEYLLLNDVYYRFDSINNDGSIVRLIKENSFETKTGLQVGMLAPEFEFRSTVGNILNTSNLHDKPLIIANTCKCGGDEESSQAYFEMREQYQAKTYVLRLDSFSKNQPDEWTINMQGEFNKDADIVYRRAYCSRICYVIGQNQRILDKFMITNWKTNLPDVLEN